MVAVEPAGRHLDLFDLGVHWNSSKSTKLEDNCEAGVTADRAWQRLQQEISEHLDLSLWIKINSSSNIVGHKPLARIVPSPSKKGEGTPVPVPGSADPPEGEAPEQAVLLLQKILQRQMLRFRWDSNDTHEKQLRYVLWISEDEVHRYVSAHAVATKHKLSLFSEATLVHPCLDWQYKVVDAFVWVYEVKSWSTRGALAKNIYSCDVKLIFEMAYQLCKATPRHAIPMNYQ